MADMRRFELRSEHLRLYGGILLFLGIVMVLQALEAQSFYRTQAMGETSGRNTVALEWGVAEGILGVVLLTTTPNMFLRLNHAGMIVFTLLIMFVPILCWAPWLIPPFKQSAPGG